MRCVAGVAKTCVWLGDDAKGQEQVDLMLSRFKDDPNDLGGHLLGIGEEYYFAAHTDRKTCATLAENGAEVLPKAIAIWQRIIEKMPDSATAAEAWYFTGAAYRKLGDIERMICCYQAVVDGWPEFKFNWSAQPLIGWGYEALKEKGLMTADEADPLIEDAYLETLAKYPQSCMSQMARDGLVRLLYPDVK